MWNKILKIDAFYVFMVLCFFLDFSLTVSILILILNTVQNRVLSVLVTDGDQYMWDLVCPQALFIKVKRVTAAVQLLCVVSHIQQTKN